MSQNSRNQGFSYFFFAWWWKDPDPRGTNIDGSGRPKNLWILLIRIHWLLQPYVNESETVGIIICAQTGTEILTQACVKPIFL